MEFWKQNCKSYRACSVVNADIFLLFFCAPESGTIIQFLKTNFITPNINISRFRIIAKLAREHAFPNRKKTVDRTKAWGLQIFEWQLEGNAGRCFCDYPKCMILVQPAPWSRCCVLGQTFCDDHFCQQQIQWTKIWRNPQEHWLTAICADSSIQTQSCGSDRNEKGADHSIVSV